MSRKKARDFGDEKNLTLKQIYPTRKTYLFEYSEDGKSWHIVPYNF